MKEQAGKIIDFVRENRTVPGCTISKQIYHENGTGISIFSLAKGTNISAESYEYYKLWTVYEGEIEVFTTDGIFHRPLRSHFRSRFFLSSHLQGRPRFPDGS